MRKKKYFISFLVLFLAINGFYGPRTVRKHIFGFFRESRLEIILI
jgi:hypothetical protein